jgi:arylsulfatase A-like enzyme
VRPRFARVVVSIFACLASAGCALACQRVSSVRPSVLLVTVDTLRADFLHCYGFPLENSSEIDALAARGVLFENAIATASATAPTHASIMTSLYPREHSIGTANGHTRLEGGTTLAEHFRANGYATAAVVSNLVLSRRIALDRGFQAYEEAHLGAKGDAESWGLAERTTRRALALLDGARSPFFLWVHYGDPHGSYQPPPPYDAMFPSVPLGSNRPLDVLPQSWGRGGIPFYQALDGLRHPWDYNRLYAGEVAYADHWIGVLLDAVERAAPRHALVVALTADHGESLGEFDFWFQHGHATTPEMARVPLVIAAPGLGAGRVGGVVSQVDVSPTLLELAGLSPASDASGVSLVPSMRGEAPSGSRVVFSEGDDEVSAYATDGYVRARRAPGRATPGSPSEPPPAPRLRLQAWKRSPDGSWVPGTVDPVLPGRIEAHFEREVPLAPSGAVSAAEREALAALGYVLPPPEAEAPAP